MPFEPVTFGLKFQTRFEHLTARDVLIVTCPSCNKRWEVPPYKLLERYHPMWSIDKTICHPFKCTRCGFDGEPYWHIMRAVGPEYPRIA